MVGKYCFMVYDGDKVGRIKAIHRFQFVIEPVVKVVSSELLDEEMNILKRLSLSEDEQKMMVVNIKDFLFKKVSSPFVIRVSDGGWLWSLRPKFTEEDKKRIQRMYLLEEL